MNTPPSAAAAYDWTPSALRTESYWDPSWAAREESLSRSTHGTYYTPPYNPYETTRPAAAAATSTCSTSEAIPAGGSTPLGEEAAEYEAEMEATRRVISGWSESPAARMVKTGALLECSFPWPVCSFACDPRPGREPRVAVASFANALDRNVITLLDLSALENRLRPCGTEVQHSFPAMRMAWAPHPGSGPDFLASVGSNIYLWENSGNDLILRWCAPNDDAHDVVCPYTGLAWDQRRLVTSSPTGLLMFWDTHAQQRQGQPISYSGPLYDVAIMPADPHTIAIAGPGLILVDDRDLQSFRLAFDVSKLRHGTSVYRLAWTCNSNYIAFIGTESSEVYTVDVRTLKVLEASRHALPTTSVTCAPELNFCCSTSLDKEVVVWDITKTELEPYSHFPVSSEPSHVQWIEDWICVSHTNRFCTLHQ